MGCFNYITPLPMDVTQKMSDYEFLSWILTKLNEWAEELNQWREQILGFRDWALNTFLQPDGNLVGSLDGRAVGDVLRLLDSNRSTLLYLVNQFQSGQTGLVIDGGFFTDEGINKNYNGGYFT